MRRAANETELKQGRKELCPLIRHRANQMGGKAHAAGNTRDASADNPAKTYKKEQGTKP